MKAILKNNSFAIILQVFILLIIYTLQFIPIGDEYFMKWIFSVFIMSLYFFTGYSLTGPLLLKEKNRIKNFMSFSIFLFIGFGVWLYCLNNRLWIIKSLDWIEYLFFFPFLWPYFDWIKNKFGSEILLLFSLIPTVLLWVGMELKNTKKIKSTKNDAILANKLAR